jgi:hypothetical protein
MTVMTELLERGKIPTTIRPARLTVHAPSGPTVEPRRRPPQLEKDQP